ncbi:MAG: hypothetical protein LIO75_09585 [Lachnospiraceae bacterium]|nr:hypothetical protein [Lachnospiraceae bacterium]
MKLKRNSQRDPQRKPDLKQWGRRLLVVLLAGGMLVSLAGCEESLAFVEQTYWYEADEIDYEVPPQLDSQEENDEENESATVEQEDDERDGAPDWSMGVYEDEAEGESVESQFNGSAEDALGETDVADPDAEVNDDSSGRMVADATDTDLGSSTGTNSENTAESGAGFASEDGYAILGGSEGVSNMETNPGIDEEEDTEESDLNAGTEVSDDEEAPEIWEPEEQGPEVQEDEEEPEDGQEDQDDQTPIVSCGTVIATGEAAILTRMLGGAGALYATDQATYTAMAEYFPSDELEDIEILWSGDSTGSVNTDSLDALIAEGKVPQACLLDAGALNEDDVSALTSRGISCTALSFDSYESMRNSATIAAATLGTDTAEQRNEAYASFCDGVEELVGDYESVKYTGYTDIWDSAATLTFYGPKSGTWSSRLGMGTIRQLASSPAPDIWNLAGVQNIYSPNASPGFPGRAA